ncbi:MAG: hypothetical protein EXR79_12205 [Myxococcales bacterium]|nr:hypothetical protein [Myxococcales bacterium]
MTATPFLSGTPIPLDVVAAPLRPLVQRDAQLPARLRVARGVLPAPPDALIPALFFLCQDPEPQVKQVARETLASMPSDVLLPVLRAAQDPYVLDAAARVLWKAEEPARQVALNHYTADDTVRWLAGVANAVVCDVIGRNQVRALRAPGIIEAITLNPRASQGVVHGLLELAVRENLDLDHMPGFREMRSVLIGEEQDDAGTGLSDLEFASALLMATGQIETMAQEGAAVDDKRTGNLAILIGKMSIAQKIRTALVGDAACRKLLIRDPKKIVAYSVLKSPRLTEGEITLFAAQKSLAEEIIAAISRNRTWTKDYGTRKALVCNPKTPVSSSMNLIRTLSQFDLKHISQSRDVSPTVARTAKRMLDALTTKKKG